MYLTNINFFSENEVLDFSFSPMDPWMRNNGIVDEFFLPGKCKSLNLINVRQRTNRREEKESLLNDHILMPGHNLEFNKCLRLSKKLSKTKLNPVPVLCSFPNFYYMNQFQDRFYLNSQPLNRKIRFLFFITSLNKEGHKFIIIVEAKLMMLWFLS